MSCMNAFEVKTCKVELFLLANDTENEMVIFSANRTKWLTEGKKRSPKVTGQNICAQLMSRVSELYRNPSLN